MAWNLVVRKQDGRILFAQDSSIPLYTQKLWSPVDHAYSRRGQTPAAFSDATCHNYKLVRTGSKFELVNEPEADFDLLSKRKAELFQQLHRALERHVAKTSGDVSYGQEVKAELELDIASFDLGQPGPFKFLELYANEQLAPDINTAVTLYKLQLTLRRELLLEAERQRVSFTRRILEATHHTIESIRLDLSHYERSY